MMPTAEENGPNARSHQSSPGSLPSPSRHPGRRVEEEAAETAGVPSTLSCSHPDDSYPHEIVNPSRMPPILDNDDPSNGWPVTPYEPGVSAMVPGPTQRLDLVEDTRWDEWDIRRIVDLFSDRLGRTLVMG